VKDNFNRQTIVFCLVLFYQLCQYFHFGLMFQ
jgi:hypothetical protein